MNLALKLTPIQSNTIKIIIAIGIIKVAFFLKDVVFANFFGIERSTDIYFYSLILPTILFTLISGSFNSFFIPTYLRIKTEQGPPMAKQYASSLILCGFLVVLFIGFVCGWIIPSVTIETIHGFRSETEALVFMEFSRVTALFFAFYLASSLLGSLLQAEHRYLYSFYPQLVIPLMTAVFIIFGHRVYYVYSAVYGMLLGAILCFLIFVFSTYKLRLFDWSFKKLPLQKLTVNIKQLILLLVTGIFPSLINVLDQFMAGSLGEGQLTALNYGVRIPDGFSEILGMGLAIAVFSHFSQWAAEKRYDYLVNATQRIIIYVTLFVIPLCFYLVFFATPLVRFLFERGAFSPMATLKVSEVLVYYAFVIYLFVIGIIGTRIISALSKNQLIFIFGATNLAAKVVLNIVFIKLLGLRGIPLATLGMYAIGIVLIYYLLHKEGLVIFTRGFVKKLLVGLACVVAVSLGVLGIRFLLFSMNDFIQLTAGLLLATTLTIILVVINRNLKLFYINPL